MQLQVSTSNEKPKSHYKNSNKNQRGRALRFPGPLLNFDRLSLFLQLTTSSRAGLTPHRRAPCRSTAGERQPPPRAPWRTPPARDRPLGHRVSRTAPARPGPVPVVPQGPTRTALPGAAGQGACTGESGFKHHPKLQWRSTGAPSPDKPCSPALQL